MNWHKSISKMTGNGLGDKGSIPGRGRFFRHQVQTAPPSYPKGTRGNFTGADIQSAKVTRPASAEVKNAWNFTRMAWAYAEEELLFLVC